MTKKKNKERNKNCFFLNDSGNKQTITKIHKRSTNSKNWQEGAAEVTVTSPQVETDSQSIDALINKHREPYMIPKYEYPSFSENRS